MIHIIYYMIHIVYYMVHIIYIFNFLSFFLHYHNLNRSIFHLKLNKIKHIFIHTVLYYYTCSFPYYSYLLFFRFVVSSLWSESVSLNCSSGWVVLDCAFKYDTPNIFYMQLSISDLVSYSYKPIHSFLNTHEKYFPK